MLTAHPVSSRRGQVPRRAAAVVRDIDRVAIDTRVFALFDNVSLRSHVRRLDKVELSTVWRLTQQVLSRSATSVAVPLSPIEVHRRMLEGLAGETLLVSSAMFLNNLADVEKFFGISFKTIKARLGGSLDTAASERVSMC